MEKLTPMDSIGKKIVDRFRTYAKEGGITWDAFREVRDAFEEGAVRREELEVEGESDILSQ